MHRTDKYSQHSSIILPVWLNGWELVYKLSGCGFESRCCHLIFKLWFFVRVFSKTLIVNYVVFTMQLDSLCLASWVYWERTFYASKNVHMIFPLAAPIHLQDTYINDKTLGICTLIQAWSIGSWTIGTEFFTLKTQCFLYFVLGIVSRNYKTKKIITSMHVWIIYLYLYIEVKNYRTSKVSNVYIWNVK